MSTVWVVAIEVDARGGVAIDIATVRRLMERMAESHPATLYSPNRYALQLLIPTEDPADALQRGLELWRRSVSEERCGDWPLVRAEVIEAFELERERNAWQLPTHQGDGDEDPADDAVAEAALRQVFHDPVTGLAGRQLFEDHLSRALLWAGRRQARVGVLVCDVDEFWATNRWLGDDAGDQILMAVGSRLAAMIRPRDGLARLGPDEFGVLLDDATMPILVDVAERILQQFQVPVVVGQRSVDVTVSVGLALSGPGQDAESLLAGAYGAVVSARSRGRGSRAIYQADAEDAPAPVASPPAQRTTKVGTLGLLQQASAAVADCSTLEKAARHVLQHVCVHTGWPEGRLYLRGEERHELIPHAAWHLPDARLGAPPALPRVLPGEGLAGLALASGAPAWTPDVDSSCALPQTAVVVGRDVAAGFAFPILVHREVVGVLEFVADVRVDPDESFWTVMSAICDQLGRLAEREQAAAAVAEAERFKTLLRCMGETVLLRQAGGRVSLDSSPSDLLDPAGGRGWRSLAEMIHDDDRELAAAFLEDLLVQAGPARVTQVRTRGADGSWRLTEVVGHNLLGCPEVGGVVLMMRTLSNESAGG